MVLVRSLRLNQRELDTLGLPADCFGVGGGSTHHIHWMNQKNLGLKMSW